MRAVLKLVIITFVLFALIIFRNNLTGKKAITETILVMGTTARITVIVEQPTKAKIYSAYKAIDEAFSLLRLYDSKLNFYSPESELAQVNRGAVYGQVKISPLMLKILEKAITYSLLTDGVFDVTATSLQKEGGYGSIVLNSKERTVYLKDKEAKIDLGGMATGLAIDKVVERFKKLQIDNYLIDVGGDIYGKGRNKAGNPWQVGVRNPLYQDKIIKKFFIKNQAVTTSGNYIKKHIIDPNSGSIADGDLLSVSVIASTCLDADVFATVFFVMGPDRAKAFISEKRNDIKALFVVDNQGELEIITYNWDQ